MSAIGGKLVEGAARPIASVINHGDPRAAGIGAILGASVGGAATHLAQGPVVAGVLAGGLFTAFLAAAICRRPIRTAVEEAVAGGFAIPPAPGKVDATQTWVAPEFASASAVCEHGLWVLPPVVEGDPVTQAELGAAIQQFESGQWPVKGVIVPWPAVLSLEQLDQDPICTGVAYGQEFESQSILVRHVSREEQQAFAALISQRLGCQWEQSERFDPLWLAILIPLLAFILVAGGGAGLGYLISLDPRPPKPDEKFLRMIGPYVWGGLSLALAGWVVYCAIFPTAYTVLRPARK